MQSAAAVFTINETGKVEDVSVTKSTGVVSLDKAILELLYKMPKWLAAEDENGNTVKQQFELVIGNTGC